jgi:hypothetical protein
MKNSNTFSAAVRRVRFACLVVATFAATGASACPSARYVATLPPKQGNYESISGRVVQRGCHATRQEAEKGYNSFAKFYLVERDKTKERIVVVIPSCTAPLYEDGEQVALWGARSGETFCNLPTYSIATN